MAISAEGGGSSHARWSHQGLESRDLEVRAVGETGMLATATAATTRTPEDRSDLCRDGVGWFVIPGISRCLKRTGPSRCSVGGRSASTPAQEGPEEAEEGLKAHPSVSDAIVKAADAQWGQRACALVTLRTGAAFDAAALARTPEPRSPVTSRSSSLSSTRCRAIRLENVHHRSTGRRRARALMDEQIKAFIRRSWDIIETPGDPAWAAPARPCAAPAESPVICTGAEAELLEAAQRIEQALRTIGFPAPTFRAVSKRNYIQRRGAADRAWITGRSNPISPLAEPRRGR